MEHPVSISAKTWCSAPPESVTVSNTVISTLTGQTILAIVRLSRHTRALLRTRPGSSVQQPGTWLLDGDATVTPPHPWPLPPPLSD